VFAAKKAAHGMPCDKITAQSPNLRAYFLGRYPGRVVGSNAAATFILSGCYYLKVYDTVK